MVIAAAVPGSARAQPRPVLEAQAYPAGVIASGGLIVTDKGLEWAITAGFNVTRRRDWGEHDDERGDGPGLGTDLIIFPGRDPFGWFTGARLDVWRLDVDWRDYTLLRDVPERPRDRTGSTRIVVMQPTARLGYRWALGARGKPVLDAHVALGAEINVRTDGEQVGRGAILLVGCRIGF